MRHQGTGESCMKNMQIQNKKKATPEEVVKIIILYYILALYKVLK